MKNILKLMFYGFFIKEFIRFQKEEKKTEKDS